MSRATFHSEKRVQGLSEKVPFEKGDNKMQNTKRRITLKTVLILATCLALATPVLAQISATFDLSWNVIGSGGGPMESDQYTLRSTIGQPAVGTMGGSGHDLCSGFWCGGGAVERHIYLPLVVRNFSSTSGSISADDFGDGTLNGSVGRRTRAR
jgi:hypothetical protein